MFALKAFCRSGLPDQASPGMPQIYRFVANADVALNGTKHTLHDYSPEIHIMRDILSKSRLLCIATGFQFAF